MLPSPVERLLGLVPGVAIAGATSALALLRDRKPLHPKGVVGRGELDISGAAALGVPVLDTPGSYEVTARFSWAIGVGPERADIHGLAVRFEVEGALVDWLLASTGAGRLDRFVLQTREPGTFGTLTTLLPVDSPAGPLLLRAEPEGHGEGFLPPAEHQLYAALGRGGWQPIGRLGVVWSDHDERIRFDAVAHPTPGAGSYPLVTTLRTPAYRLARLLRPNPKDPAPLG